MDSSVGKGEYKQLECDVKG